MNGPTKVGQLDAVIGKDENVFHLDIAVCNVSFVKVHESRGNLANDELVGDATRACKIQITERSVLENNLDAAASGKVTQTTTNVVMR